MATVAHAPASPSSSPRLPSPPPFPEVQLPPKSPSPGASPDLSAQGAGQEQGEDTGATRRIRPGTKAADMAAGPPLVPLSELDSPFQLQEHLLALFLSCTRSPSSPSTTIPISRESATTLATAPEGVDRSLWLYELCRLLVQRANSLIVGFFADNPPCSAAHCSEMRASEWQYLCAVHDPPKACCAIDYCCHTLDWAANVLTSQKHFPSRLSLGGDAPGSSQASVRQLTNVFRRVYRMFAHAWFQHREVFWKVEGEEGLYVFYKTVCDVYGLILEENYTVPKEAEGAGPAEEGGRDGASEEAGSKDIGQTDAKIAGGTETADKPAQNIASRGATTRRHKQTPSTGSFVTTIAESDEDGNERGEGLLSSAPSFVSTVRRDPSSSPPKKGVPMVMLPDLEEGPAGSKREEAQEGTQSDENDQDVTQKVADMSIEDTSTTTATQENVEDDESAGLEDEQMTRTTTIVEADKAPDTPTDSEQAPETDTEADDKENVEEAAPDARES